jgi:hypothetical protein
MTRDTLLIGFRLTGKDRPAFFDIGSSCFLADEGDPAAVSVERLPFVPKVPPGRTTLNAPSDLVDVAQEQERLGVKFAQTPGNVVERSGILQS